MFPAKWIIEDRGPSRSNMYPLGQTVAHTSSQYQEILIVDTPGYNRALFLDGVPQSAELDEQMYHEALIHPALVAVTNPKTVFIAGGGEGAVLREVLKHTTIEKVIMVDIDEEMVNLAKQHLEVWHQGAFNDPRVHVLHEDARVYLEQTTDRFDCIYSDLSDPFEDSPAASLFSSTFFSLVKSRLTPGGAFALQTENTDIGWCKSHVAIIKNLQQSFAHVKPYQYAHAFFGLPWGFAVASEHPLDERLSAQSVERVLAERQCQNMRFYDGESHTHMFALPKYLRDAYTNPEVAATLKDAVPLDVASNI